VFEEVPVMSSMRSGQSKAASAAAMSSSVNSKWFIVWCVDLTKWKTAMVEEEMGILVGGDLTCGGK
jgi:hypothetical protein